MAFSWQVEMSDETKPPSQEELLDMVNTFSQHADNLLKLLEVERHQNKELNTENAGWLDVYQRLQSENAALKVEKLRLESRIRELQGGN